MTRPWTLPSILGISTILLAGCATTSRPYYPPTTGDPIADGLVAIEQAPPHDRGLWLYITAAAAMQRSQFAQAKPLLDEAIARIEGRFTITDEEKRSRGTFGRERNKPFIGEPYERSMAYFYRGIIYWMDREWDNARACFRSAQFHDSSEEAGYDGDYALFDYLDGFLTSKLGGDGSSKLESAKKLSKLAKPDTFPANANVFIFFEMGNGPSKYKSGEFGQKLQFRPGGSRAEQLQVKTDKHQWTLDPADDLSYQAQTRGGREMDHILGNQAVLKSVTEDLGDAAILSGVIVGQDQKHQEAAIALVAAGVLSKIISGAASVDADTRQWNNLPHYIGFAGIELSPGAHDLVFDFVDQGGKAIPSLQRQASVQIPSSKPHSDTVIFVSDK